MITRIEVDGFKSFQGFTLDIEPLTIVAGPNSAGKSNLFDCLQLLSRLADTQLTPAFELGRGKIRDQFSWLRGEPGRTMKLGVDLLLPETHNGDAPLLQTRLRYGLNIERREDPPVGESLIVATELIRAIKEEEDSAWAAEHPSLVPFAKYGAPGVILAAGELDFRTSVGDTNHHFKGPGATIWDRGQMTFDKDLRDSTVLCSHGAAAGLVGPHITAVRRELTSWRFPSFDLRKLRNPSEPGSARMLAQDGSNLPTVLAALPRTIAAAVKADLADLIPGVREFEIVLGKDEFGIEVSFTDGERVPARILSDGTLRLLAFLTLLRSAPAGGVVAHEEPEEGLFPARLAALLEKLVQATEPTRSLPPQLLLNTHSPAVLSILRHQPSAIVLADRVARPEGTSFRRCTRMRRVSEEARDRGAAHASPRELQRILDVAGVDDRP